MKKMKRLKKLPLVEIACFAGLIIFVMGAVRFAQAHQSAKTSDNTIVSSSTERDIAIQEAIKQGKKDYSYTTNFIPGVGYISDPAAYEKSFEDQANAAAKK